VYSNGLGGGGFAALVILVARGRPGAGGGGACCLTGGTGGGGLLPEDEADPTLPPLVAGCNIGGKGTFIISAEGAPNDAIADAGLLRGRAGSGFEGARLNDGFLSNVGGGGGRLIAGGGGGALLDAEPFGGGGPGVGFGDFSGGGGGLGNPVGMPLPGLDFNFGGATGGVVGVAGREDVAVSFMTRFDADFGAGLNSPSVLGRLFGGGGGGVVLLVDPSSSDSFVRAGIRGGGRGDKERLLE